MGIFPNTAAQYDKWRSRCIFQADILILWLPGMSQWLNLTAFLGTADSAVHIVHISRVITAYTLDSLSSLTLIEQNLQATINFKKKELKKRTKNKEIITEKDAGSVQILNLQSFN